MAELDRNDWVVILFTLSNMMRFIGASMVIPVIVSIIYNELIYTEIFAVIGFTLVVVFTFLRKFIGYKQTRFKHAIISIALAWFTVGVVAAIPFLFFGISPIDAFFESVSGWSGTGMSMIPQPEFLPHSLNFWRGFIQWMGGFGIVLLALLFYDRPETIYNLFVAEGRSEEFFTSAKRIARTILSIYFIYTILGVALFLFAGLSLFDAVIHSFTSIATGGFSTNSVGVGLFGPGAMSVAVLLMLLGGISFEAHYDLLRGKIRRFLTNPELKFFFTIIFAATVLVFINFFVFKNYAFFDAFFYIVSAITGTGNTNLVVLNNFPALSLFVIILLMIFGACYGSTTGALKIWRILILFQVIRREIHKAFLPSKALLPIKIGSRVISDEAALKALSYMVLYIFFLALGAIIFMLFGYGLVDSIFTVASAQGNVGLNVVSGNSWFAMPIFLKFLLSLHMIIGRMEILPLLILLKGIGFGSKI
ncbi:MAG: TrkH family potassium uptake protein [archaeon]